MANTFNGVRVSLGILSLTMLTGAISVMPGMAMADFPERPVKIIVPLPSAGGADILVRAIGEQLSGKWHQPVLVENRPGAGGNVAAAFAAKEPNDGYTVLLGNSATHGANQALYARLGFDPVSDFVPIVQLVISPVWLLTNPKGPFNTLPELVSYAKANPGKLNYGSVGNGSPHHLAAEALKKISGIDLVHVPYKGAPEMVQALIANDVQLNFDPSSLPYVKSGQLRALVVLSDVRRPSMPNIPTSAEQGYANLNVTGFMGLFLPRGAPAAVVRKINSDVNDVLAQAAIRQRILGLGLEPVGGSAADFQKLVVAAISRYGQLVRDAGAKID